MNMRQRFATTLLAGAVAYSLVGLVIALAGGPRTVAAVVTLAAMFTAGYLPALAGARRLAGLSPEGAHQRASSPVRSI